MVLVVKRDSPTCASPERKINKTEKTSGSTVLCRDWCSHLPRSVLPPGPSCQPLSRHPGGWSRRHQSHQSPSAHLMHDSSSRDFSSSTGVSSEPENLWRGSCHRSASGSARSQLVLLDRSTTMAIPKVHAESSSASPLHGPPVTASCGQALPLCLSRDPPPWRKANTSSVQSRTKAMWFSSPEIKFCGETEGRPKETLHEPWPTCPASVAPKSRSTVSKGVVRLESAEHASRPEFQ